MVDRVAELVQERQAGMLALRGNRDPEATSALPAVARLVGDDDGQRRQAGSWQDGVGGG
ncbi:MAG: hypothetical protein WD249_09700 [Gaiellaceae bacterium]